MRRPLSPEVLLESLRSAPAGLSVAMLVARHPGLARRTAQRWLAELVAGGRVEAIGAGRGRRYRAASPSAAATDAAVQERAVLRAAEPAPEVEQASDPAGSAPGGFPAHIPLSADSVDILAYVAQPVSARKPVGYQRDFLDSYEPNRSWYLSEPLRRRLRKMGDTGQAARPAGTHGRAILNRLLIDLSWASSHLEGNTYSRLDTVELIERGRAAEGKAARETQMILNHKAAIELLVDDAASIGFNRFTLLNLHSTLSENLLANPADEGRIRQHGVEIGQSVHRPLSVPAQIDELLDRLLEKAGQIGDPFEQSFFMMVHLPYLQPFADVNKRTSRLAANLSLIRENLCPLTFVDVPEPAYSRAMLGIYEMTRVELLRDLYLWAYERSTQEYLSVRQDLAEPDPLRLAWRQAIRQAVREVVRQPGEDALEAIDASLAQHELGADHDDVKALVIDELRRLHEGVLARYGLRPSELARWQRLRG